MAFEQIDDKNAGRVQAGEQARMVGASGQAQNQTLQSMGLQDVSGATRTATALGKLAQDVTGNVVNKVKERAFIEAYSGAGAGRSVKELREEQPAWESIFGPTATIQGAQLRELNNAVANFGNEGLSMVENMRSKDPAEFHQLLSKTVTDHFTGDAITDQLIMQKSLELIPEIAASQYKANAKYVQEVNLVSAQRSVEVARQSMLTYQKMPKEQQSEEGRAKVSAMFEDAILNSYGMDPTAHRGMIVNKVAAWTREGDFTGYDIMMNNFVLSDKEDEKVTLSSEKGVDTAVAGTAAALKDGEVDADGKHAPDLPAAIVKRLSLEHEYKLNEARKEGNKKIEAKDDFEAAQAKAELIAQATNGVSREDLLFNLAEGMRIYPSTVDKDFIASTLAKHDAHVAEGNANANLLGSYMSPGRILDKGDQLKATRLYKAAKYAQYPDDKGRAEKEIWDNWALGVYGTDPDITDAWNDMLNTPLLQGGKSNKQFDICYAQFKHAYKLNPELALMQVSNEATRARLHGAMRMIDMGLMDETGVKAAWANSAELDARGVLRNPEVMKELNADVADMTKGGLSRLVPFMKTNGKVFNTAYVEYAVKSNAEAVIQYNGVSAESAYEVGKAKFLAHNEFIAGNFVPNDKGIPLANTMGLKSKEYTANDAVMHVMKRQGIENGNVKIIRGVAIISPCDENGIANGKPSWQLPLTTIGDIFNKEVIKPGREAIDRSLGRTADEKTNALIQAQINMAAHKGIKLTWQEAIDKHNAQEKRSSEINKKIVGKIKEVVGPVGAALGIAVGGYTGQVKKSNDKNATFLKKAWDDATNGLFD